MIASDAGRPPSAGGSSLSNSTSSLRRFAAKFLLGAWKLRNSARAPLELRNVCTTFGGTSTNVPAGARTLSTSGPTPNSSSPSSTKNASVCSWWMCGSGPLSPSSYRDHVTSINSCSNRIRTVRSAPSDTVSPPPESWRTPPIPCEISSRDGLKRRGRSRIGGGSRSSPHRGSPYRWKRSNRSLRPSSPSRGGAGFPFAEYLPDVLMFHGLAGSTLIHGGVGDPLRGVLVSNRWLRDASVGNPQLRSRNLSVETWSAGFAEVMTPRRAWGETTHSGTRIPSPYASTCGGWTWSKKPPCSSYVRRNADLPQWGEPRSASIVWRWNSIPTATLAGGCSSNSIEKLGTIHETFGSVPAAQSS